MTPMQELTEANLTERQYIHFTGWLAVILDSHGAIDRQGWSNALLEAKGSKA